MCVSDQPTDPKILPSTLTFFIPPKKKKKKKIGKIRKFVSVSEFNNRRLTVAQASTLTYFSTCPFGQLTKKSTCPTQSFSCSKKLIKITKTRE